MSWKTEFALAGAGGEPVDLWRTIASHGVADLPPNRVDDEARALETTLPLPRGKPQTVLIREAPRRARVSLEGRPPSRTRAAQIVGAVKHVLRLDEDLSEFYALVQDDPDLAWAAAGAGRMVRSPTVFEDVVKTICTTNCAWSATVRMVSALVEHLGERAPGAPASGPYGRSFPTPTAMAEADEGFYRDVVRAGYRGAYLRSLADSIASRELDLEQLDQDAGLSDEEVAERLLALPCVGPYAAAHMMMLLGRYTPLVLDSWTRPKYARLNGGKAVTDAAIERRFRPYGPYAGLAFWLFLTRDWVPDPL